MNTKVIKKFILAITVLSIVVSPFLFIQPAYATVSPTNWNHVIPFTITDTSGVARTNLPVTITYDVNGRIVVRGLSNATFTNTYMDSSGSVSNNPIGSGTATKYLGATSNITVIIPSLPAYGSVTTNLYTGYSPSQSSFPIILGHNGFITTSDTTVLELLGNGAVSFNNIYVDTTQNTTIFEKAGAIGAYTVKTPTTANVSLRMVGVGTPTVYPYVSANKTGKGTADNFTITLPTGTALNDLLILTVDSFLAGGAVTYTTPSGWTLLSSATYDSIGIPRNRNSIYYKIATSTSSFLFDMSASAEYTYIIMRIPTGYYSGVPVAGVAFTTDAGNPDPPNLVSGFGAVKTMYLALGAVPSLALPPPAGYTGNISIKGATSAVGAAYKQVTAASENPGIFNVGGGQPCAAQTLAIKGYATLEVSYAVASGEKTNLTCSVNSTSGNLTLWINGVPLASKTRSSSNVTNSSNPYIFGSGFPYADSISITVNGTRQLYYAPNALISGTTLPDRETTNGLQNGAITWGTNSGITVTGGDIMTSLSATVVGTNSAQFQASLDYMGTFTANVTISFEYGMTTSYSAGTIGGLIVSSIQTYTLPVTGLQPNTTYHYRAIAQRGSVFAYGADVSFTTLGSSASGGSTNPTINDVNIFRNYTAPGDGSVLLVVDLSCSYPPYYPNSNPSQYFQVDLVATNNVSILGATPVRLWGERPLAIYFRPSFVTSNITWGSAYYVKLVSTAANVTVSYHLTSNNWKGYDLSVLDKFCISTAKSMELSDGVATGTYVVNTTGQGEQISDSAGSFFTVGIPSIGDIRPNLFTTSQTQATPVAGGASNSWDKGDLDPAGWRSYVGAVIAGDIDTMAIPFGINGKDFAAGLVMIAIIGAMILVVSSTGGFGALGSVLLAVPLLWLGVWFRMVPIAALIFAVLFFGLFAIRQFIIKPL